MELGAFSVSLSVTDLKASMAFYARLGFEPVAGNEADNWIILRNGTCTLGLFQGMFTGNMLTFNPGWQSEEREHAAFTDIRDIQAHLQEAGITLDETTDPAGTGPAHILLKDPDGNAIFLDQHVPAPTR
ncbi:glyoxalase/bleomycin resistance protein/dioxygenase superfamily protein [Aliiruegeria haliotis]|uniref:Glyoxalase/bleomycin resistance protein/dioxygenase superfamily protein n=1 Tax=Aliiruegeria haliotis TaxID=1280846 RepID=A0A2T0RTG7_9RHOB|nr:VOC family protein [Aliiruegeria haliotis]PRY24461.1 glyoxalase/bleomycin resistance protein/dioxygenase superfamily protein [Aliiruegeria haliotis]